MQKLGRNYWDMRNGKGEPIKHPYMPAIGQLTNKATWEGQIRDSTRRVVAVFGARLAEPELRKSKPEPDAEAERVEEVTKLLVARAKLRIELGQNRLAAWDLEQAINLKPEEHELRYHLAIAYAQIGNYRGAQTMMSDAMGLVQERMTAALNSPETAGQPPEQAVELLERSAREILVASVRLGHYMHMHGICTLMRHGGNLPGSFGGHGEAGLDFTLALQTLAPALDAAKGVMIRDYRTHRLAAEVHLSKGELHLIGDRLDEAESEFGKALEVDPTFVSAKFGLAEILHAKAVAAQSNELELQAAWLAYDAIREIPLE